MNTQTINGVNFYRIRGNDVVHFLAFLTDEEKANHIFDGYGIALAKARKLGGRKFHNK